MQLKTRATIEVPRAPAEVFDFCTSPDALAKTMHKKGAIPGVLGARLLDATALAAGVKREVSLSDKSKLTEEITGFDRPALYAYRWASSLAFPLKLLVRGADTEFRFSATPTGTRIDWEYRFTATTPLVYPLTKFLVWQFRGWMEAALEKTRAALENKGSGQP